MFLSGIIETLQEWFSDFKAKTGQILFYDASLKLRGADPAFSFKFDDTTPVADLTADFLFSEGEYRSRSHRGQLFHGWDANHGNEAELTRFKGGDDPAGVGANARVEGGAGDTPVNHGIVQCQDVLQLGALYYADLPMTRVLEWGGGAVGFILDADVSTWGAVISGGGSEGRLAWYNGTDWTVVG